jgi:AraC-like DNA-binding protein
MPSLHLMINFGDSYNVYEPNHIGPLVTCAESWSVGLWNSYHLMDWPQNMQLLSVSFKPGGAYPFLQLPLSELHNQIISLDTIWGRWAAEIRERLYGAPTIQARFALLEQLLLGRLCDGPHGLKAVQYAVAEISRHCGTLSIRTLSDQMGISQKHLITQFKQWAGGTPKELARIYRFRDVLFGLDATQAPRWGQVAYQHGYYDQAHFNQDFAAFTGHSPTEYWQLLRQVHNENPQLGPKHVPTG